MEYQVPQFIEVEDKIIGPLTLKQFIYVAGTIGLCVLFFTSFSFFIALILSLPVAGLGLALAFYKVNNKPFISLLEAAFNYFTHKHLMIWKYTDSSREKAGSEAALANPEKAAPAQKPVGPRLTRGKLSELAWSLDVKSPDQPSSGETT